MSLNIWATFVTNIFAQNFKNSPNLVTLFSRCIEKSGRTFVNNGPTPASFIFFDLFKQTSLQFLQQMYVKKCPSSTQFRDSNPRPSEHESPSITTRPGQDFEKAILIQILS